MKHLLILMVWLTSTVAIAESDDRSAKASPHNVSALLGHNAGGFNFGVAYEHMLDNSMAFGAHVRMFNKEDSGTNLVNGYLIIGASAGFHFYKKTWDLGISPSVNMINIDSYRARPDDASVIGPGLGLSLLTNITSTFAIGFENAKYWVWFDDDYAGLAIDDFAVKARLSF
jgi:hypothetical protein